LAEPLLPAPSPALAACQAWVDRVVVGLNLCPFAAAPLRGGEVRWLECASDDPADALAAALDAAGDLVTGEPSPHATTLLVLPHALPDFLDFWDAVGELEDLLAELGLEGTLQVASFHPGYRFDGEPAADALTNRSPHPMIHLLREADVSEAVARHPDARAIPARNVATVRALSAARVRELWGERAPGANGDR
jgi:hypothetical protein